jgi:2-polyprenyl-3-methyl-5-hydroxy-6-metoxy-1,4-benzoquinol methylase
MIQAYPTPDPHYRLHQGPRSSHQQIVGLLRRLNRGPVLDVGAAQGMLGQQLQTSGLVMDAVEANPQWALAARPFYRRVLACPIETALKDLPSQTYNTIVCGDVLEHLADPVEVLRRLRELAMPDAAFVISLPNIAHLAVRLMLLLGSFGPMQRGPLDRTHLHFYTRTSARRMLEEAGLRVDEVLATPVPLEEALPGRERSILLRPLMELQRPLVRLLPRLFAFQWIFLARAA